MSSEIVELFAAVRKRNPDKLKAILSAKAEAEVRVLVGQLYNETSLLTTAIRCDNADIVSYLISDCGADVEQEAKGLMDGKVVTGSPLCFAVASKNMPIIRLLVEGHNVNINAASSTNLFPLLIAATSCNLEIVSYLITSGADMEQTNTCGTNALIAACNANRADIVRFLLSRKCATDHVDASGLGAMHHAVTAGHAQVVRELLVGGAAIAPDGKYGDHPITRAALAGNDAIVDLFLSSGRCSRAHKVMAIELLMASALASQNFSVDKARNLFNRALLERARPPVMVKLLDRNCRAFDNVQEPGSVQQFTAKISAINSGNYRVMLSLVIQSRILGKFHKLLCYFIEKRAVEFLRVNNGKSLQLALQCLKILEIRAEPLKLDHYGIYYLIVRIMNEMVARNEYFSVNDVIVVFNSIQAFLERSKAFDLADLSVDNLQHLMIAYLYFIELLERMQGELKIYDITFVNDAIGRLLKVKVRGQSERSLLHLACSSFRYEERKSIWYKTAPTGDHQYLCDLPNDDVIAKLLACGAECNAADANGDTPMHVLAAQRPIRAQLLALLMDAGADGALLNAALQTPFDLLEQQSPAHAAKNDTPLAEQLAALVLDSDSESDDDAIEVKVKGQAAGNCIICLEREINCALIECGHQCVCCACAAAILKNSRQCPICRAHIVRILKTFTCVLP